MCGLAFDDAEQLGVGRKVGDDVFGLAAVVGLGEEVQAAIDHFNGDGRERLIEGLGDAVGEIDEDGVEQPSGPDLDLDDILCSTPEIGQPQQAFDDGIGILDPPALPIQGHQVGRRQALGIQGRAIYGLHLAVMLLRPGNFGRHRSFALGPAVLSEGLRPASDVQEKFRGWMERSPSNQTFPHYQRGIERHLPNNYNLPHRKRTNNFFPERNLPV